MSFKKPQPTMQEWTPFPKEFSTEKEKKAAVEKLKLFLRNTANRIKALPEKARHQAIQSFDNKYKEFDLTYEKMSKLVAANNERTYSQMLRRLADRSKLHAGIAMHHGFGKAMSRVNTERASNRFFDKLRDSSEVAVVKYSNKVERGVTKAVKNRLDDSAEKSSRRVTDAARELEKRLVLGTKWGEYAARDWDTSSNPYENLSGVNARNFIDAYTGEDY